MTRVLVTHASRHGGTAETAERIAGRLRAAGLTADVLPVPSVRGLAAYDAAIIGGTLHEERWPRAAHRFVRRNRRALAAMPVLMFSSGPPDGPRPLPPRSIARLMRLIGAEEYAALDDPAGTDRWAKAAATRLRQIWA
ncbi:flavodoxin domain-containing protein [Actinomadura parmotrematis]|uniref:Flavodoxin domain-containing protein n=1 Tax=Actinomadura parmotrematis TaxID=2864039 RepID=A0ABS7G2P0_9ACTN|nr:flavodoxin domain-containing protein [Actinomadura parmotrematis]MBW8486746.1 flavodoxin domain-containing protein [Actinomadura parmotrematis]